MTEIKYLEDQINARISAIETTYFEVIMGYSTYDNDYGKGFTKNWIYTKLKDLFYLIIAYLEERKQSHLLELLITKYKNVIDSDTFRDTLYENTVMLDPEGESELAIIVDFKRYIAPYKSFNYQIENPPELNRLESILRNTAFILQHTGIAISKEADIYNEVKWILELYFPSIKLKKKASFIRHFKTYDPDILITELKTAVEYKYFNDTKLSIDDYLDQIKIDATNYVDDPRYEFFYAVLYIEDIAVATTEKINLAWDEKEFPSNWRLIVCAHPTKKSQKRIPKRNNFLVQ